ncbi:MAG: hypothetical protein JO069_13265 [Verrucomicrobia bacterium]|nr:hypothetical protein [Verrucomicrobiota bacterium]
MSFTREERPIAPAMLPFPGVTPKGRLLQEQGPDQWASRLQDVAEAGFAYAGTGVVSFGLFQALTPAQQQALWSWTAPGPKNPDDPAVGKLALRRLAGQYVRDGLSVSAIDLEYLRRILPKTPYEQKN